MPLTRRLETSFAERVAHLPVPVRTALEVTALSDSGELAEISAVVRRLVGESAGVVDRAVRTANSANPLATTSTSEWTASLTMPRLPVSRPTTSFARRMATPIATETAATSCGRRPRDPMSLVEHRSRGQELLLGAERDDEVAF